MTNNHDLCPNVLWNDHLIHYNWYHAVQSVELQNIPFPSQRSSVICNSQTPTGFGWETNTSFHGAGGIELVTKAPQCEPSYLGALFLPLWAWIIISPLLIAWWHIPNVELPPVKSRKKILLFFADFALRLHYEIPGCGHQAMELSYNSLQRLHQGRKETI